MKKCFTTYSLTKITLAALAAAVTLLAPAPAQADTSGFHGGNWSSWVGLVDNDIQYPAGITSTTTVAQAQAVADTIACDYKAIGINFVRFPVNPATVTGNWSVTQACINELISQGLTVDIGCWYIDADSGGNGLIRNMSTWQAMWQTVDGVYHANNSVYYEPINEPFGYTAAGLESVYTTFLGFITKSQSHIILDGTGYSDNVTAIGGDSSFNSCLLSVHDYAMWNPGLTSESGWESDLYNRVNPYQSRTIMTEFGAVTTTGLYYGATTSDNNISFIRGMCNECQTLSMGSVYFPAHQPTANNNKRLFYGPGGGAINPSIITELQSGWGLSASWHTWDNPAAGSGFTTGFAACSWGSYREDIFGVKSDGNIYHTWWFNNSGWNTWEAHACPVAPAGAPGASANNGVANREDIYYIGTDGNLYHQYYSGGWQPSINTWENLGAPSGVSLVGSPSATSWAAGRYDVYARGSNNTVYRIYKTSDTGSWSAWQNQGGSVTNDVASESWSGNRLDGYALGTGSGAIWHQYWDGAWHPTATTWAQNTPETNAKYALGASSWGTNHIDLFDNNGSTIGHVWYDGDLSWHGNWSETHTPPVTPKSAPCATSWAANRVDVFVLGSDGKCYHLYWGL